MANPLLTKLTGKDETFTNGNFLRLQGHLREQHPETFGCGNLGACAGKGEKELWGLGEGGAKGEKPLQIHEQLATLLIRSCAG